MTARVSPTLCARLVGLGALVVVAGCGSGSGGEVTTDTSTPRGKVPAQIVDSPQGYVSSANIQPFENAWRVASSKSYTEIDAGALASDETTGVMTIFRQDFDAVNQQVELIKVLGSGPLKISKAPEGKGVEESAQESGKIEFVGENGVKGTLDLSDDSVTLEADS